MRMNKFLLLLFLTACAPNAEKEESWSLAIQSDAQVYIKCTTQDNQDCLCCRANNFEGKKCHSGNQLWFQFVPCKQVRSFGVPIYRSGK